MATQRQRVQRPPALPGAFKTKLYKTGQTRGAAPDEIFQNRVLRCNTVLVPYAFRQDCLGPGHDYHSGFIVLLSPGDYFGMVNATQQLAQDGLTLGMNARVVYETREAWNRYPPAAQGWQVATSRTPPLGGQYVARVPATTSGTDGAKINLGFTTTAQQGVGIRVYEYADEDSIRLCRLQLEALFGMCADAEQIAAAAGMTAEGVVILKRYSIELPRCWVALDMARPGRG